MEMPFFTPTNDSVGEVLVKHMGLVSVPIILHPISLAFWISSLTLRVTSSTLTELTMRKLQHFKFSL